MKKFLLCVLPFALCPLLSFAWERTYGGTGADFGYSVQQTLDTGYIIAGYTNSFGDSNQVYLIKTDSLGDTLWTRTYGGAGNDYGYSVQQTLDMGYIIAGYTNSFGDSNQVYLIKTNATGDTLWTRTYGGAGEDYGYCVQQTADSGYIVVGGCAAYLVKTYANGDTAWTKRYISFRYSMGRAVQQTTDGGYIVVGTIPGRLGNFNTLWLFKTNASGDTIWTRRFGSNMNDWEGNSVQQTLDGNYIVAGKAGSSVWLAKVNTTGDTIWTRFYGGTGVDLGYSVQQTLDTGYIIAGYTNSFGNGDQVYLINTNATGDTLWTRTYGGTDYDYGCSVQQTIDTGYIIAGYTNSFGDNNQVYLIKTDSLGNSTDVEDEGNMTLKTRISVTIFSGPLRLPPGRSCRVFDITGRVVKPETIKPGIYFVEVDGKISQKVIKVR